MTMMLLHLRRLVVRSTAACTVPVIRNNRYHRSYYYHYTTNNKKLPLLSYRVAMRPLSTESSSTVETPEESSYTLYEYEYEDEETEEEDYDNRQSWEPDPELLTPLGLTAKNTRYTLTHLIRTDRHWAREFFINTLYPIYKKDTGMLNRWGVLEYSLGDVTGARRIFKRASKFNYDPILWQSWATMELKERNFAEAEKLFKIILHTPASSSSDKNDNTHHPAATLGLIKVEQSKARPVSYIRKKYQEAYDNYPDDMNLCQAFATFESQNNNLPAARKLFQRCVEHETASHLVWQAWANAEKDIGDLKFAASVVSEGLTRNPLNAPLLQVAAIIEFERGNFLAARAIYHRMISQVDIPKPEIYTAWGNMEESLGNLEVAKNAYQSCLSDTPTHLPAINSLASMYRREGNLDFARRTYDLGFSHTNGENARLAYDWGKFEESYGNLEEARRLYKQASTYKTYWHVPLVAWASAEYALGNKAEARVLMQDATSRFESSVGVLTSFAKMELSGTKLSAARKILLQALRLDDTRASVWNLRALVEFRAKDYTRALTIVETAFKYVPAYESNSWAVLMSTYARVLAKLERFDDAESSLEKAITLNPKNDQTYVIGAQNVLVPQQKFDDAIALLTQALKVSKLKKKEFISSVLQNVRSKLQQK